jgi:inhibitor of cysteine peptidase
MIGWTRVVIIACLAFATCIAARALQTGASGHTAKASSPAVTITEQDNGKDVDLSSGETLIVKLTGNPSTGYGWTVAGDPAPLKLQKTSFVKNSKSSQNVGAPGTQVLRFSASSAGMATLTVVYRRSWEYNLSPMKTFSLRVNVR